MVKCVNFVRRKLEEGQDHVSILKEVRKGEAGPICSDDNLQPVIEDDELLLLDYEEDAETALRCLLTCSYEYQDIQLDASRFLKVTLSYFPGTAPHLEITVVVRAH